MGEDRDIKRRGRGRERKYVKTRKRMGKEIKN